VVTIHPLKIEGHWQSGVALDLHTTSSTPIGAITHPYQYEAWACVSGRV